MNLTESMDNRDKLMMTAIELIAENGYKGVSTKQIAASAGVSEMTLFRQFGNKQNLIEQAIERYHYGVEMFRIFEESVVWELSTDLKLISRMYHEVMNRNRQLFLVVLKNDELSDLRSDANRHPRKLLKLLTDYFVEMRQRNKVIAMDAEAQAAAFMWMNYGAFMSSLFSESPFDPDATARYLTTGIELFARGLTP